MNEEFDHSGSQAQTKRSLHGAVFEKMRAKWVLADSGRVILIFNLAFSAMDLTQLTGLLVLGSKTKLGPLLLQIFIPYLRQQKLSIEITN